jgi:siroheme synthase-like protein
MSEQSDDSQDSNRLFPVFLKLEQMRLLSVGGGKVGLEKLQAVLANSPLTETTLVSKEIDKRIVQSAASHPNLSLQQRAFVESDVYEVDVVIVAIDDPTESKRIRNIAKQHRKLVNVADKPELCDFYLGSIVQKGHLKIAISTNGKSPTIAKRLKELFNSLLPDQLNDILNNMSRIRSRLTGTFTQKVEALNRLTSDLAQEEMKDDR